MNDLTNVSTTSLVRTTEHIAAEINSIKAQTRNMMLYNSIEIGRRLTEAKTILQHGEWGNWLTDNVDYSKSTANNLMRIFDEYGASQLSFFVDNAKTPALGSVSYTQAVALMSLPEDERETFVEEHDMETMTTRELQQAIKERDQALKEKDTALNQAKDSQSRLDKAAQVHEKLMTEIHDMKGIEQKISSDIKEELDIARAQSDKKQKKVDELLQKIKELESKPLEIHQGATEEDVEAIKSKLEAEYTIKLVSLQSASELAEKRLKDAEEKSRKSNNEAVVKYSVHFDTIVKNFQALIEDLKAIKETDAEMHERYSKAVTSLLEKMKAWL